MRISSEEVTIIIPHLGADEQQIYSVRECLNSLRQSVPDIKKIVVFNGKIKHAADIFEKNVPEVTIVLEEQGQCKAVNAAVATTNTKWILVSNDDMVFPKEWFQRLTNWSGYDPYCISPMLVEPRSGAPTFLVKNFGGAGGDFRKDEWDTFAASYTGQGIRTGFNLPFLIRRELWDTIGGYDINYDPWGSNSDSDLEYKIKLAGVQPYQNTSAIVYHFSQTSGTFHPDNQGYWNKNWDYFIQKWGFPRTDEGIWEANFEIPKPLTRKFRPKWKGLYDRS